MAKPPLKLRDKPAENIQKRKLDPVCDPAQPKHDERASDAFTNVHVQCENSFQSVNPLLYQKRA